jgi:hypothetical protein
MRWPPPPLIHFLAGGAMLYVLVHGPTLRAAPGDEAVVVSAEDVARLRADYTRETGLVPTSDDEAALVDEAVDEELLVREARQRGLDRHDRSIRSWLVEQMQVLSDEEAEEPERLYGRALALGLDRTDLVVRRILVHKIRLLAGRAGEQPPSDAALRAFFGEHQDDYRAPDRVSFWHVFFATATRGACARSDAVERLDALRLASTAPGSASGGDTFAAPPHVVGQSAVQVAKLFGEGFAAEILSAPERVWVGPVASPFGVHLVWIETREPGTVPPFEAVRGRVRERWLEGQRAARVSRLLHDLRRRHPLEVESAAWRARGRS